MNLLPIVPGCQAIITAAKPEITHVIGTEVTVVDRVDLDAPCDNCKGFDEWEIEGGAVESIIKASRATLVSTCACGLMRIDGNPDEQRTEQEQDLEVTA